MIAWLAVEAGIAPSVLLSQTDEMLDAMIKAASTKHKQQNRLR
jgi:hypothetical protein